MDFSTAEILTILGTILGSMILVANHVEKKKAEGIGGLTCFVLSAAFFVFWLILFYSVYLLIGNSLALFGQERAPYLIRVLWPTELLPYAPFFATAFAWWETTLFLIYWVYPKDETEQERRKRLDWYVQLMRRSTRKWMQAYFLIWAIVQIYYRTSWLSWIPLPDPI